MCWFTGWEDWATAGRNAWWEEGEGEDRIYVWKILSSACQNPPNIFSSQDRLSMMIEIIGGKILKSLLFSMCIFPVSIEYAFDASFFFEFIPSFAVRKIVGQFLFLLFPAISHERNQKQQEV